MTARSPETTPSPKFPTSSFKYNPLHHIRMLFVQFAQGLFGASPQGAYHWSADDETTEIYIADEQSVQPEVVEKLPTISFSRGPIAWYSLGLDDLHSYDFGTERKVKGLLVPGTMVANCCSRNDLESEHIAWVLADHIWLLRDQLIKAGFFDTGRGIQMGSSSPAGSVVSGDRGDEFFCTPITVPFQFARQSAFTPLGLEIVNNIEQSLNNMGQQAVRSVGSPYNDPTQHEVPAAANYCPPPPFAPLAQDQQQSALPLQPHPLNPSQMVSVRVIRPSQAGSRQGPSPRSSMTKPAAIPISQPCVEDSNSTASAFTQKG